MSKQRDRDEFIATMAKEGVPAYISRKVLRDAATLHRIAELECSSEAADRDRLPCPAGPDWRGARGRRCLCDLYQGKHGDVPRITIQADRIEDRVSALLKPYGVVAQFQGDPRGAVVKLKVPSGARLGDFGGEGVVCVP